MLFMGDGAYELLVDGVVSIKTGEILTIHRHHILGRVPLERERIIN